MRLHCALVFLQTLMFFFSPPQAYNIHVNGVLHCRVRYSQLLGLHEQVTNSWRTLRKGSRNGVMKHFMPNVD